MTPPRTARLAALAALAALVAGCPTTSGSSDGGTTRDGGRGPDGGLDDPPPQQVNVPALPTFDLSAIPFPKLPDGNTLLIESRNAAIEIWPATSDPITAVGTCSDLVTYCVAPPDRTLSDCVVSVKHCATDRPWEESEPCCPAACIDAYQAQRAAGLLPLDAFEKAFFLEPDCFPGVRDALEGR